MGIFTTHHIKRRAKEENQEIPQNYQQILDNLNNMPQLNGNKIIFRLIKDNYGKHLSVTAIANGRVVCSLEWAAIYVLYNCPQTENAFLITVGHELTHKDGDFGSLRYICRNRKLVGWANEVHADFGAAQKMSNSGRQSLVDSCEYKHLYRLKYKHEDNDSSSHPSYQRRKYYAENFNFDKTLIQQIAKDVGCSNSELIDKLDDYYPDITLF